MARTLTTLDAYQLINAIGHQALGATPLTAVDTSSFIAMGESIIASGVENTLNAIGLVLGRTFIASRPYKAKFALINSINSGAYANRIRKISYYTKDALPTGADNTQLNTNFADGYTNDTNSGNSTQSMWEIHNAVPLEINFGGSSEWQYCITIYEHQLKVAFSDETEFIRFMNGIMTEVANDIETEKESFARATLLNFIGAVGDVGATESKVNMVKLFNDWYGTSYTITDLLGTYMTEFLEFFVATVKTISDEFENRDVRYHIFPAKTGHYLARHTPKSRQKMMMVSRFWRLAEATVKPQIFNEEYLSLDNFEKVAYWQNPDAPYEISVTPAVPNYATGVQGAGTTFTQDYVLGVLFDEDALMIDYQLDDVYSTPVEARKKYRNLWHTIRKNAINDLTEKAVIFYMENE